jgi:hypothetical protein
MVSANVTVGFDASANNALDLVGFVVNFLQPSNQARLRQHHHFVGSGKNIEALLARLEVERRSEDRRLNEILSQRRVAVIRRADGEILYFLLRSRPPCRTIARAAK